VETAAPLMALANAHEPRTLVWNETVVPYCTRSPSTRNNIEIRKRTQQSFLGDRGVGTMRPTALQYRAHRRSASRVVRIDDYQPTRNFDLHSIIQVQTELNDRRRLASNNAFDVPSTAVAMLHGAVANSGIVAPRNVERLSSNCDSKAESSPTPNSGSTSSTWRRKGIDASTYFVDLQLAARCRSRP